MNTDKAMIKRHAASISISAILTWAALTPIFWYVLKPVLVDAVSVAVADDIQIQVSLEISPLNSAFKVLLQNQINGLIRTIALLKDKRQFRSNEWTIEDVNRLSNSQIEMRGLQAALEELK